MIADRDVVPMEQNVTWTADNGNGTYSNPLFYDEFSDPDVIRVGDDFYLTGTTMHAMPGLPVLQSRDLVNWKLESYAVDRLDLGPGFRLEGGESIYGQGIWAPSFRYHDGVFHIFANVNGHKTQLFRSRDPRGPWSRTELDCSLHDLSVLFDDDGKIYVVWGHDEIHLARLSDDLKGIVPGTEKIIIPKGSGMGEGSHFCKIGGRYFITSAWFSGRMRMPCARADRPEGPYEVNPEISADEDFGLAEGRRLANDKGGSFELLPGGPARAGRMSLHQGAIVDTPAGEWWGVSMMDYNSVGRLSCLSPVTWEDGWPYFGLTGNLKRTPRIWVKPRTQSPSPPGAPFERSDNFSGATLNPIWQWNHVPDDSKWSLSERRGFLRLHALPASDFWWARNTLTQRAIGPRSTATLELDASGMKAGDVAGLGLLNFPYAWIGLKREGAGVGVEHYDQETGLSVRAAGSERMWLRAQCDFLTERATFYYSLDGRKFLPLGDEFGMTFQCRTFQGVRFALFQFNTSGAAGGHVDFNTFTVDEPNPRGLMKPIPLGETITLRTLGEGRALEIDGATQFQVLDRGLGRVTLRAGDRIVGVRDSGQLALMEEGPESGSLFQWTENVYGDVMLLSLSTHRHVRIDLETGAVRADCPGPQPDRKGGSCFSCMPGNQGNERKVGKLNRD